MSSLVETYRTEKDILDKKISQIKILCYLQVSLLLLLHVALQSGTKTIRSRSPRLLSRMMPVARKSKGLKQLGVMLHFHLLNDLFKNINTQTQTSVEHTMIFQVSYDPAHGLFQCLFHLAVPLFFLGQQTPALSRLSPGLLQAAPNPQSSTNRS